MARRCDFAIMKIAERLKTAAAFVITLPYIVVVIVPLLILKVVTMPFEKPRRLTPEQVAALLRKCIDGTATDGEIDYFVSVEIADPRLNEIKDEVGFLFGPGWTSPETRQALEELLGRVEAMPATTPS